MSLINPHNLYSEGNVSLDSSPYTKIVLQQRAKKQALEESANQYFNKLPEKLNTAGVRQQDLEDPEGNGGILKDIEDLRNNWYQNRDAIRKGGKAQQDHMARYDRIRQKIDLSKTEGKAGLNRGKMALTPNGWKVRESDHPVIDAMESSIYSPKHYKQDGVTPYNDMDLSIGAAPYNAQKQQQFDKAVLNGVTTQRDTSTPPVLDNLGEKVLNTHKYLPKDIYNAANRAAQIVDSDKTMYYRYEDLLNNPDDVKTASEALSKLAGTQVIASTPQQMAAGLKAHELANFTEQKEEKDVAAANAFKKKMQDERLAAQLRNIKIKEAGKNARTKAMLNGVEVPDVLAKAEKNAVPFDIELPIVGEINKVLPDGSKIESVIPLSKVDALELEDILGKKDKYNQTPIRTYRNNNTGKEFILKGQDGKFYGEGMQEISPERVLNSTYNRTKGELKATYKKEITKPTGQMTLAEKMKAAKKQK